MGGWLVKGLVVAGGWVGGLSKGWWGVVVTGGWVGDLSKGW